MKAKHSLILLTFVILILSGCYIDFLDKTIYGQGPVVTEERDISGFNGIKVSSGIDVYLKQGNSEKVRVVADENLHDVIETEVMNGILHIFSFYLSSYGEPLSNRCIRRWQLGDSHR